MKLYIARPASFASIRKTRRCSGGTFANASTCATENWLAWICASRTRYDHCSVASMTIGSATALPNAGVVSTRNSGGGESMRPIASITNAASARCAGWQVLPCRGSKV